MIHSFSPIKRPLSTYIVTIGTQRIRVRVDHDTLLAMLPIIMAARDAIRRAS